ncbi:MAG: hypothetical protein HND56_06025 [Pseudomonadota bacterium]|nr:hypothetical protein [Pseudomonadota bacterium]QKK05269.1 MAG: hypothetical protein HND56_06025 [Pseudomonadota bacterium]
MSIASKVISSLCVAFVLTFGFFAPPLWNGFGEWGIEIALRHFSAFWFLIITPLIMVIIPTYFLFRHPHKKDGQEKIGASLRILFIASVTLAVILFISWPAATKRVDWLISALEYTGYYIGVPLVGYFLYKKLIERKPVLKWRLAAFALYVAIWGGLIGYIGIYSYSHLFWKEYRCSRTMTEAEKAQWKAQWEKKHTVCQKNMPPGVASCAISIAIPNIQDSPPPFYYIFFKPDLPRKPFAAWRANNSSYPESGIKYCPSGQKTVKLYQAVEIYHKTNGAKHHELH